MYLAELTSHFCQISFNLRRIDYSGGHLAIQVKQIQYTTRQITPVFYASIEYAATQVNFTTALNSVPEAGKRSIVDVVVVRDDGAHQAQRLLPPAVAGGRRDC